MCPKKTGFKEFEKNGQKGVKKPCFKEVEKRDKIPKKGAFPGLKVNEKLNGTFFLKS